MIKKYLYLLITAGILISAPLFARSWGSYGCSFNYTPALSSKAAWNSSSGVDFEFMSRLTRGYFTYTSLGYAWASTDTSSPYKEITFVPLVVGLFYNFDEESPNKFLVGFNTKVYYVTDKKIRERVPSDKAPDQKFYFTFGPSFIYEYPILKTMNLTLKGDYLFLLDNTDPNNENKYKSLFSVNIGFSYPF